MTHHEWIRMRPGCKFRWKSSGRVYEVMRSRIVTKDGDPYTVIGNQVWTFEGSDWQMFELSAFQFDIVVEPKQEW